MLVFPTQERMWASLFQKKRLTTEMIIAPTKNPVKALPQKYPIDVQRRTAINGFCQARRNRMRLSMRLTIPRRLKLSTEFLKLLIECRETISNAINIEIWVGDSSVSRSVIRYFNLTVSIGMCIIELLRDK